MVFRNTQRKAEEGDIKMTPEDILVTTIGLLILVAIILDARRKREDRIKSSMIKYQQERIAKQWDKIEELRLFDQYQQEKKP